MPIKTKFKHIEDFLGEKSTRFFSNGYKHTTRAITNVVVTSKTVEAMCTVSMPKDWSIKGTMPQAAHLSSVDAVLIALQLSEAYCVVLYGLSEATRKAITIDSFSSKANKKPLEDLKKFKVTITLSSVDGDLLSFISHIGEMKVELQLRLPYAHNSPTVISKKGLHYSFISDILGEPSNNFYGVGFAKASHDIKDVSVDLEASSATAIVNNTYPSRVAYQGIETTKVFDHCPSPIDAMVITSQLVQCYLYLLDGLSREDSSTLWMRAMNFSIIDQPDIDTSSVFIEVVRSEKVFLEGVSWRCVNVKGYIGGMTIFYGLGHALPQ